MTERRTDAREGKILVRGVKGGVKIDAGTIVARNAAGFALPAADAAGLVVEGCAEKTVDNTGGQDGDAKVEINQGFFLYDAAGLTDADNGKDCFVEDEATVNLVGGTNKVYAGVIAEVVSPTAVWVKQGLGGKKVLTAAETQALVDAIPATPVAVVVAAAASPDATAAGVAYDQVVAQSSVTLLNELKTQLNAALAALKAAGLMAN